jgi:hypothetical protein
MTQPALGEGQHLMLVSQAAAAAVVPEAPIPPLYRTGTDKTNSEVVCSPTAHALALPRLGEQAAPENDRIVTVIPRPALAKLAMCCMASRVAQRQELPKEIPGLKKRCDA